jgi:hypothetical protein
VRYLNRAGAARKFRAAGDTLSARWTFRLQRAERPFAALSTREK